MGESCSSDKGIISRIYRELKKLNPPKKINIPMKKWTHKLNRLFKKEGIHMASTYMKCSTSLVIKEIQIKTTLRFHLTPVRMAIFKGNNKNQCWLGCSETGTLIHCW
jgi:hypothetical protein